MLEQGAFPDWNASHPSQAVRCGDRIVAVNGLDDDLPTMPQG